NTIVEAMKSKKVDLPFLPPTPYTLPHDQKPPHLLLQPQPYPLNKHPSSNKKLLHHYKSQILLNKNSPINTLKHLKPNKIPLQHLTSTPRYTFPLPTLKKQTRINPTKHINILNL
ncbi:PhnD/SsuA/transferrin family substrate-binding protein, partial [Staphylococcus capitis]|uniref:PhnD/SsuA/transferrin family substrate-binding protein n=1 Tax=Staphylococcus capitis TaxID=29388 RepID=UPI0011A80836